MDRAIGSEYSVNRDVFLKKLEKDWDDKLVFTSSGRDSIRYLLEKIEFNKIIKQKVLLPAYICESVVDTFKNKGYLCIFYDVSISFGKQIFHLEDIKAEIDIFFYMDYFGFRANHMEINQIRKKFGEEVLIVEDITHTLLCDRTGDNNFRADFEIGSLRKWFGIPTGGILIDNSNIVNEYGKNLNVDTSEFMKKRKKALVAKEDFMQKRIENTFFNELFSQAEDVLGSREGVFLMDSDSKNILNNIDWNVIRQTRIANYKFLVKEIESFEFIQPLYKELIIGDIPLSLPFFVANGSDERASLQSFLAKQKIYCPIHWPKPKEIQSDKFPKASFIYEHIMSFPIDQRYDISDMERITSALNEFRRVKC